jgi:hypothetical protein
MIDINKIFIVDDAFPEWFQMHIEKRARLLPWEFRERVHTPTYTESTLSYNNHNDPTDKIGMTEIINDALTADLIPRTIPDIKITGFFGVRWNGTIKGHCPSIHRDNNDDSHTDESQWTIVYFVNESDGDLLFYADDQTTEIMRCKYKKGRAVLFPSNIYHRATDPTVNNLRITFAAQYYMYRQFKGS